MINFIQLLTIIFSSIGRSSSIYNYISFIIHKKMQNPTFRQSKQFLSVTTHLTSCHRSHFNLQTYLFIFNLFVNYSLIYLSILIFSTTHSPNFTQALIINLTFPSILPFLHTKSSQNNFTPTLHLHPYNPTQTLFLKFLY